MIHDIHKKAYPKLTLDTLLIYLVLGVEFLTC